MSCIQWEMPQISVIFYRTTPAACEGMCRAIWKIKETSPNCVCIFGRAYFNHVCTYVPGDKTRATFHKYRAHYLLFFYFCSSLIETIQSLLNWNRIQESQLRVVHCTTQNYLFQDELFFSACNFTVRNTFYRFEKKTHTQKPTWKM